MSDECWEDDFFQPNVRNSNSHNRIRSDKIPSIGGDACNNRNAYARPSRPNAEHYDGVRGESQDENYPIERPNIATRTYEKTEQSDHHRFKRIPPPRDVESEFFKAPNQDNFSRFSNDFSSDHHTTQKHAFSDKKNYPSDRFSSSRDDQSIVPPNAENRERPPPYTPAAPPTDVKGVFSRRVNEGIDFDKYKNIQVEVSGGDEKKLFISNFNSTSGLHSSIVLNIERLNYKTPTPIQKFAIPIIYAGEYDIMACAQTGSGKTAAFLIPIFSRLLELESIGTSQSVPSPHCLVLSPTRELTIQTWNEMRKFAFDTPLRSAVLYGGVSRKFIMQYLMGGCDVLAATPGRLLDLLNRGEISLANIKYLVLDEGDRMLDMGFIDSIRKIINTFDLPDINSCRSYFFSATFPKEIQNLAREMLSPDYYFLTVGMVGAAADTIKQIVILTSPMEKRNKLIEIVREHSGSKILVFVETKKSADFLTAFLCQKNVRTTSIHGDRYQEQREEALLSFTRGYTPVLVATSVAARGLDIPEVSLVVNFDLPSQIDDYVHRIGRTGRLGNRGLAISLFNPDKDNQLAADLVKVLKDAHQDVPSFLVDYECPYNSRSRNTHTRDDRNLQRRNFEVYPTNGPSEDAVHGFVNKETDEWD